MPTTPARRPTIADAMIVCAAVAAWFAIVRASLPIRDFPARMAVPFGWEAAILAALGTSTVALLAMRLIPPRPPIRRLALQAGFAACLVASLACSAVGMPALAYNTITGQSWNPAGLLEGFTHGPGFAVAGAWLILALGGIWRPVPADWLDRLGRAAGVTWILSPVAFWIAMVVILQFT
jgi:hypothetical protein